jgi:hypothetical protein
MTGSSDSPAMKEIKAIIPPVMLSRVMEALKSTTDLPGVREDCH